MDMVQRGHEVEIFHAYSKKPVETSRNGIRIHGVKSSRVPLIGGYVANREIADSIDRVAEREPFDVLDLRGAGLGFAFGKSRKGVRAHIFHAVDVPSVEYNALPLRKRWLLKPTYTFMSRYERLAVEHADWTIVDTADVGRTLERLYPACSKRWSALPPALPAPWSLLVGVQPDESQFLYIGAGIRRDTGLFIRGLAHARRSGLDMRGVVLRNTGRAFIRLAERLQVPVTFLSRVPEEKLRRLYATSCAFVLPSYREAFCRPIVEAASQGTPSIVSNLASVREFVRDGETGIVIPDWRPAAWGDAMIRVATDKDYRDAIGRKARSLATNYQMERIGAETESCYRLVLEPISRRSDNIRSQSESDGAVGDLV